MLSKTTMYKSYVILDFIKPFTSFIFYLMAINGKLFLSMQVMIYHDLVNNNI